MNLSQSFVSLRKCADMIKDTLTVETTQITGSYPEDMELREIKFHTSQRPINLTNSYSLSKLPAIYLK